MTDSDDLRTRAREAAEWLYPEPQHDSLTYPRGSVRGYMRGAFTKGALWHAAQQPTLDVDEVARVLHDAACTRAGTAHTPQWWENRERSARAVVAHLTKGDENDE